MTDKQQPRTGRPPIAPSRVRQSKPAGTREQAPARPIAGAKRSRLPKAIRRLDPMGWVPATAKVAGEAVKHPQEVAGAAGRLAGKMIQIPGASLRRLTSNPGAPPVDPGPRDKRFADPTWDLNPLFFGIRQGYLATCNFVDEVIDSGASRVDPLTGAKAKQFARFAQNVASPTNLAFTNPEVLSKALQTGGKSLYQGLRFASDDAVKRGGRPMKVDRANFTMGQDLAATPGKVVFRNEIAELIQYSPQTEKVHEVPILMSPPWVNKYYVMDLAPNRSFIEWAVKHERTVFVLSYVNPDQKLRNTTLNDYLENGVLNAVDVIADITGSDKLDIVGLCLGGIAASIISSYLAVERPGVVNTLSLQNTPLDLADPGELGSMLDPASVNQLEEKISKHGYLHGDDLSFTFDMMRANDLIFNYVVSRWLKGEAPPAFDILAWNEDGTHLAEAFLTDFLQRIFRDNEFAEGEFKLAGVLADPALLDCDVYIVGAINDHIVPWVTSYKSSQLFGGQPRYVLSSGGHIAGIVNPPGPKNWFEALPEGAEHPASAAEWREEATKHTGTWWEDWVDWSNSRAGELVDPPPMGSGTYPPIEDAPGTYVLKQVHPTPRRSER